MEKDGYLLFVRLTKPDMVIFSCGIKKSDKIRVHEAVTIDKKYLISLDCTLTKSGIDGSQTVNLVTVRLDSLRVTETQPQKLIQIM